MKAMTRTSHERSALVRFQELADARGLRHVSGQHALNRVGINGNVYYQHGDLRVDLPDLTLIVEVESSGGGTTNLVKYWECYETGRLTKPMRLLHIFRQLSANDYEAHMVVWRFLCEKMHAALGDKFQGVCLTYRHGVDASLEPALATFSAWIAE